MSATTTNHKKTDEKAPVTVRKKGVPFVIVFGTYFLTAVLLIALTVLIYVFAF